jgi:hypothetical protein
VLCLGGCASSQTMEFGIVSVDPLPISPTILKENVVGEDCPSGTSGYGSYSKATQQAISSVNTANALINAQFSRTERPVGKICVKVIGDAVRL